MRDGVPIMGIMTQKCEVQKETSYIFRITLIQGMNRQIRKMCEHFGYEVVQLERIRVMNITLKGIGVGDWRELTEKELGLRHHENDRRLLRHQSMTCFSYTSAAADAPSPS